MSISFLRACGGEGLFNRFGTGKVDVGGALEPWDGRWCWGRWVQGTQVGHPLLFLPFLPCWSPRRGLLLFSKPGRLFLRCWSSKPCRSIPTWPDRSPSHPSWRCVALCLLCSWASCSPETGRFQTLKHVFPQNLWWDSKGSYCLHEAIQSFSDSPAEWNVNVGFVVVVLFFFFPR